MEPHDNTRVNGNGGHDVHLISTASLNRIINPLSVALGYVQLIQRQIRSGRMLDQDELLRNLEQTEAALKTIEKHVRELTVR